MDVRPSRIPWTWLARIAGSAIFLTVLLTLLPAREVWETLRAMPPGVWFGSLVVFVLGHCISANKWRLLVGPEGLSVQRAITAHFAGLAANLCLPGAAGGDVIRAGYVYRDAENKAQVALGSLVDRLLDASSLCLLVAVGVLLNLQERDAPTEAILPVFGVLVAGALLGGGFLMVLPRLPLPGKLKRIVDKLGAAAVELRTRPGRLLGCLALSLLVQSTFVGINIGLAEASHMQAPAAAWFFAWPIAKLIAMIPISIGGLGQREASLAALLAPFGAEASRTVAVGLVWQTILFASGLLGALLIAFTRGSRRPLLGQTADREPAAPSSIPRAD